MSGKNRYYDFEFKQEAVHLVLVESRSIRDAEDLKHKTFEYIECCYNRKGCTLTVNILMPAQYENYFYKKRT